MNIEKKNLQCSSHCTEINSMTHWSMTSTLNSAKLPHAAMMLDFVCDNFIFESLQLFQPFKLTLHICFLMFSRFYCLKWTIRHDNRKKLKIDRARMLVTGYSNVLVCPDLIFSPCCSRTSH